LVSGDAKGLAVTDLNQDQWPDLVVGVNNDRLLAFQHGGQGEGHPLTVCLQGLPGNPTAVGARVTVGWADGISQTAEVQAGSGYLSQSTASLTFGLGTRRQGVRIEVVWPDGSRSDHPVAPEQLGAPIRIRYPGDTPKSH
jgi:hypothetical protein